MRSGASNNLWVGYSDTVTCAKTHGTFLQEKSCFFWRAAEHQQTKFVSGFSSERETQSRDLYESSCLLCCLPVFAQLWNILAGSCGCQLMGRGMDLYISTIMQSLCSSLNIVRDAKIKEET